MSLLSTIADFMKQLYGYFYLEKNGIKIFWKMAGSKINLPFNAGNLIIIWQFLGKCDNIRVMS